MVGTTQELEARRPAMVRIDRADLPDFVAPVAMFGSRSDHARSGASDDMPAELMSCLHPFHCEG